MFKSVLSELMRKIIITSHSNRRGLNDIDGSTQSISGMSDVKLGVSEKTIKIKKAAKKAKDGLKDELKIGGCAGTREGCDPEKKIKNYLTKR